MKRILSVLIACVCASVHLYADANEERCVLEEYNGRQSHTPLVGVDVKVSLRIYNRLLLNIL